MKNVNDYKMPPFDPTFPLFARASDAEKEKMLTEYNRLRSDYNALVDIVGKAMYVQHGMSGGVVTSDEAAPALADLEAKFHAGVQALFANNLNAVLASLFEIGHETIFTPDMFARLGPSEEGAEA